MRLDEITPPRRFRVGPEGQIELSHCADLRLDSDEMVTFKGANGSEYDVTRKTWGYYSSPSLNDRLGRFGLRAALIVDAGRKVFLMTVEAGREPEFEMYLSESGYRVLLWFDDPDLLDRLEAVSGG